ncbi:MAG: RNA polymerase sigma factor [Deltaproteobacteria bacterium]
MASGDQALVHEIISGDVNAYALLVNRYQKPIYNLMLRMTGSEQDAVDLTQETFVKAYEKLEKFDPSAPFFPWLYTMGLNLARDFLRRAKRSPFECYESDNCFSDGTDEDERLADKIDVQDVWEGLKTLPVDYREALLLRFHEGLSVSEVAHALGLSLSAAKMRIHRGLSKLRELLKKQSISSRV